MQHHSIHIKLSFRVHLDEMALQRAETRMVRWMSGVKLQDRVPSKVLKETTPWAIKKRATFIFSITLANIDGFL